MDSPITKVLAGEGTVVRQVSINGDYIIHPNPFIIIVLNDVHQRLQQSV